MKIAIVATLYPPHINGGAEVSTQLLAEGLRKAGHDVFVITSGERDSIDEVRGIKVYRLRNRNIYWRFPQREKPLLKKAVWHLIDGYLPLGKGSLTRILQAERPDVVHTGNLCGITCCVWPVARSLRIPLVHTLRDYALMCPQQTMMRGTVSCKTQCTLCKAYTLNKKRLSQKVDAVVGISSFILGKHLTAGYFAGAALTEVIPNSVLPIPSARKRGNKVVGYMGRLSPEKGIELLAEAFSQGASPDMRLLIAGDGNSDYVEALKSSCADPRITFKGRVEAAAFLDEIDLLVVPSLWDEPFGRVVIEAYAASCPVLVAANGGLTDLVRPGLSCSFSTADSSGLRSLIEAFSRGELRFDSAGFTRVLAEFSAEAVAERYLKIYNGVIASARR